METTGDGGIWKAQHVLCAEKEAMVALKSDVESMRSCVCVYWVGRYVCVHHDSVDGRAVV